MGDVDPLDAFMSELNRDLAKVKETSAKQAAVAEEEEEEVDPLDAFMAGIDKQVKSQKKRKLSPGGAPSSAGGPKQSVKKAKSSAVLSDIDAFLKDADREEAAFYAKRDVGSYDPSEAVGYQANTLSGVAAGGGYDSDEDVYRAAKEAEKAARGDKDPAKKSRRELQELPPVNHHAVDYLPIRRPEYIEHPLVNALTDAQVQGIRSEHGIEVLGKGAPAPVMAFDRMKLDKATTLVLDKLGFTEPTPIQAQAVPIGLLGRDVVGIAKTGSGKTLAFVIPMFMHIKAQPALQRGEGPIGLVVGPTRELAEQILQVTKRLAKAQRRKVVAVFGGMNMHEQWRALKAGCDAVVATPGRLMDLLRQEACSCRRVSFFVLDEADRMFQMGFEWQIRSIVNQLRPDRQTMLFSATFQRRVERLARDAVTDPIRVAVGVVGAASSNVRQVFDVLASEGAKRGWLQAHLHALVAQGKVIIFVGTKQKSVALAKELKLQGHRVLCIHGDMPQPERSQVLWGFKRPPEHAKAVDVLVATDVAARGLDIKGLETVVNYDCARDVDAHVHRVGRTGRAGKDGIAYSLLLRTADLRFACALVASLRQARQPVPGPLASFANTDAQFQRAGGGRGRGGPRPGAMGGFHAAPPPLPGPTGGGAGGAGRRGGGMSKLVDTHHVPPPSAYSTEYKGVAGRHAGGGGAAALPPTAAGGIAAALAKAKAAAARITAKTTAAAPTAAAPAAPAGSGGMHPDRMRMLGLSAQPPAAAPAPAPSAAYAEFAALMGGIDDGEGAAVAAAGAGAGGGVGASYKPPFPSAPALTSPPATVNSTGWGGRRTPSAAAPSPSPPTTYSYPPSTAGRGGRGRGRGRGKFVPDLDSNGGYSGSGVGGGGGGGQGGQPQWGGCSGGGGGRGGGGSGRSRLQGLKTQFKSSFVKSSSSLGGTALPANTPPPASSVPFAAAAGHSSSAPSTKRSRWGSKK